MFTGRLIQDEAHSGTFNMAADLYLADLSKQTGEVNLRLYSWAQPTLSLGYHQKLSDELFDKCLEFGISVVRRPTGGRAVLHDRELTYALTLPATHALLSRGREALLRRIGEAFVEAAAQVSLEVELVRRGGEDRSEGGSVRKGNLLCFDSVSRWEVQIQGRKWIGSAQRFLPGAFLQHGSIVLENDDHVLSALLGASSRMNIDFGDLKIDLLAFCAAIPEAFTQAFNLAWRREDFSIEELTLIKEGAQLELSVQQIEITGNDRKDQLKKFYRRNHATLPRDHHRACAGNTLALAPGTEF